MDEKEQGIRLGNGGESGFGQKDRRNAQPGKQTKHPAIGFIDRGDKNIELGIKQEAGSADKISGADDSAGRILKRGD